MYDIERWLRGLDLGKYVEILASHDIDLTVIPDLTEQDLEKLGLSLGHRRKFLSAASKLRASTKPESVEEQALPSPPSPAVERRQLTVAFIDLVGSTAL